MLVVQTRSYGKLARKKFLIGGHQCGTDQLMRKYYGSRKSSFFFFFFKLVPLQSGAMPIYRQPE